MQSYELQLGDEASRTLKELSRERGRSESDLATEIIERFLHREAQRRVDFQNMPELTDQEVAEDRWLAEAGVADYYEQLKREDSA